ncbi:chorismate lyase [Synechocystis sp. LKSZ1]|uniref:chorismate lyase n=1 Tax=Synechocystis sp. LKSZ1 TaxID=3144951 RepID=UPI00336BE89B
MKTSVSVPPATAWYRVQPLWQGDQQIVQQGLPHPQLAPAWQMLILGDGSPTRHLQLLTGEKTEVDVIDMSLIGPSPTEAPPQIHVIPQPWLQRQVWLRTRSGKRLAYAVSWWDGNQVDDYLENRNLPIWDSLSRLHTELYREVLGIFHGPSPALAAAFQETGPFWGRYYLFWHHGQPLTLIYEVFSPYLQRYLGPTALVNDSL